MQTALRSGRAALALAIVTMEMVRDADDDCVRDGLHRWCTDAAREQIDLAIAFATVTLAETEVES